MKARKAEPAFTLVEVLIAMLIFSIVVLAIYSSWSAILRSTKIGQQAAADAQRARVAVRSLHDALVSIQMFPVNIGDSFFYADTSADFPILSFVARLPRSYPRSGNFGDQVYRRLTFTVEPGANSENRLVLRQNPVLFEPDADEDENPLILARNLKLFALEFWGSRSTEWETEWLQTNQLPSLIRFTIGCATGERKDLNSEEVVTRVVSISGTPIPPALQTGGAAQSRAANVNPSPAPPTAPNPGQ